MTDPLERMPMRPLPPGEDEARLAWKAIFARRVVVAFLLFALVGTLVLNTITVVLIRNSQEARNETFQLLVSCTNGKGACSKRGQRQTAAAVGQIRTDNRHTAALAASCATVRYGMTATEIEKCINARLAAEDAKKRRR